MVFLLVNELVAILTIEITRFYSCNFILFYWILEIFRKKYALYIY